MRLLPQIADPLDRGVQTWRLRPRASGRSAFIFLAFISLPFSRVALASEADYGDDIAFLKQHVAVIELSAAGGRSRLAVIPAYQGRVMTSSAAGRKGFSFGWINRELIASGQLRPHMNVYGGEERIWLGPEGGPFALFFSRQAPAQTLAYWQTPPLFDTQSWRVEHQSRGEVQLSASGRLVNRAGTPLEVGLLRSVRLLEAEEAEKALGRPIPGGLSWVGYETRNRLTNRGSAAWRKETGLPSIWLLGQFKPGRRTTIVVPFKAGAESQLGRAVRSDYFGAIPAERLKIESRAVFFRADGRARGKIGISARRAKPVLGSWDSERGVLTVIEFTLPEDAAEHPYVDSRWIDSVPPYAGDAVNAYNDGPPSPGAPPLGPFYELETSSPAAELKSGETLAHLSLTFHFMGERSSLDSLARETLGVGLEEIESVWQ